MEDNTVQRKGYILEIILLTTAAFLYFFANFHRSAIPGSVFSELQTELNVNAAMITGLGAACMYIYALCQLFVGILADKYGGHRIITFGGILLSLGALLFPFSGTLFFLYLSRIIVGIGASSVFLCLIKEVKRTFPKNFGPVMGLVMLIGYAGNMVANAPLVITVHKLGWRNALLAAGILTFAITLLFLCFRFTVKMPEKTEIKFNLQAFRPAVNKRHNWMLYLLTGFAFAIYYAVLTILGKKILEDYCGMKSVSAGWVLTAAWIISAVANMGTPICCRFVGERRKPFLRIMGTGTLLCTVGMLLALCLNWHAAWFFSAGFLLLAFCANMTPVYLMVLSETNPSSSLGVCASFSNFMTYVLVAILGNLSGPLMDLFDPQIVNGTRIYGRASYIAVFILYTVFAVVGQISALGIRETFGKQTEVK